MIVSNARKIERLNSMQRSLTNLQHPPHPEGAVSEPIGRISQPNYGLIDPNT
jgi:hypothetical protein